MMDFINIALVFLLVSIYCYVLAEIRSRIDAYLTKKNWGLVKSLNHYTRFLVTLALCSLAVYVHFVFVWQNIFLVAYMMCLFSLFFDPLYNLKMERHKWYVGNTNWLDLVVRAIFGRGSGKEYAFCKVIAIEILLSCYFIFK